VGISYERGTPVVFRVPLPSEKGTTFVLSAFTLKIEKSESGLDCLGCSKSLDSGGCVPLVVGGGDRIHPENARKSG